jgi:hypothetical protein
MPNLWLAGEEPIPAMTWPPRRQPRSRRRRGVAAILTERDEALLHAVARFRLARTSDLVAYAFASVRRDTAVVRLRRLFDARYLAVMPPTLGVENVYRLGPAGKVWLAGDGVRARRVPRGGHAHHLAIVQTWVAIAGLDVLELERVLPDWEIREQFSVAELTVVPDLLVVARVGERRHAVAVEVDRATESLAVLHRKLEAYRSLWGQPPGLFGFTQFGIALVCTPTRWSPLAAALKKAWVVPHVLWSSSESPSAALRKLFADLQAPLAVSPCPKGTQSSSVESENA